MINTTVRDSSLTDVNESILIIIDVQQKFLDKLDRDDCGVRGFLSGLPLPARQTRLAAFCSLRHFHYHRTLAISSLSLGPGSNFVRMSLKFVTPSSFAMRIFWLA